MRICVISRSTTHHFKSGGMETQLDNLLQGLKKNGHDVVVITTAYSIDEIGCTKTEEKKGITYYYLGDTTPGLNSMTLWESFFHKIGLLNRPSEIEGSENFCYRADQKYSELAKIKKFDILVSQSTAAKNVIDKHGAKLVAIIHGTIRDEIENRLSSNKTFMNWGRFLAVDIPQWAFEHVTSNRRFFQNADAVVAVSEKLKKSFLKDYPNYDSKTHVIYNGVDENVFSPATDKRDGFNALYIGRMQREKGVDIILQAVRELSHLKHEMHFDLVGDGIHLNEFKRYVKEHNLEQYVTFHGQVDNTQTPQIYKNSDVFVFPTRRNEGHPMTVSEALCSGIPVVCTKRGGLAELIESGTEGYYIEDDNPKQLGMKVLYLFENPDRLIKMKKAARELALKKFTRTSMIKHYEELFSRLVSSE
ncbi:MAG: glycosyltransferase family 4 protein [Thermosphaera sp.]